MTDDTDLLHKFAKLLKKFDGSDRAPAELYNSDAEEFVALAREHFSRPAKITDDIIEAIASEHDMNLSDEQTAPYGYGINTRALKAALTKLGFM